MSLFFYLFTFAINLWLQKFVIADVAAVLVNNQHDRPIAYSNENKTLIKTHKYTRHAVTRKEKLKLVHLKCNLFAFSSISAEYLHSVEI